MVINQSQSTPFKQINYEQTRTKRPNKLFNKVWFDELQSYRRINHI